MYKERILEAMFIIYVLNNFLCFFLNRGFSGLYLDKPMSKMIH